MILYVVSYSTDRGIKTGMKRSGITDTSTTLTELEPNTTYYVWVAAEILGAGVQGPYSMRISIISYSGKRLNYVSYIYVYSAFNVI